MKKPFFAKFLESQVVKQLKAGDGGIVTLKYPSDWEDDNNGPCSSQGQGNAYGYGNGAMGGNPNCLPIAVTLKYPSDSEDTGTII